MYICCILCYFEITCCTYFNTSYLLRFLNLEYNKSDKNHVVSQMAHAKNIGEPFMAHAKKLYNIPWGSLLSLILVLFK